MRFGKIILLVVATFSAQTAQAQIPTPARIGGSLTVDGTRVTQNAAGSDYSISVKKADGTDFSPAAQTTALNSSDAYIINIPILHTQAQPGGAQPGQAALIQVSYKGTRLNVTSPAAGNITVGESGSLNPINIEASSPTTPPTPPNSQPPNSNPPTPSPGPNPNPAPAPPPSPNPTPNPQPECRFTLSHTADRLPPSGGALTVSVNTSDPNCEWDVVPVDDWISVSPNFARRKGNIDTRFNGAANPNPEPRRGVVRIAGIPFTVNQEGQPVQPTPSPSPNPTPQPQPPPPNPAPSPSPAPSPGPNPNLQADFLAFVQGNPGLPGDDRFVNGDPIGLELTPAFPLRDVSDGITISVYPRSTEAVRGVSLNVRTEQTSGSCAGNIGVGPSVPYTSGRIEMNGVLGFFVNVPQSDLWIWLEGLNSSYPNCKITLAQVAIWKLSVINSEGMVATAAIDAIAIRKGQNAFIGAPLPTPPPSPPTPVPVPVPPSPVPMPNPPVTPPVVPPAPPRGPILAPSTLSFPRALAPLELMSAGFAIVNPARSAADVVFNLYDLAGRVLASSRQTIAPGQQLARLGSQLFSNISQTGWVQATSPLAGLKALWIYGERSTFVDGAGASVSGHDQVLPIFDDRSEISVANIAAEAITLGLKAFDTRGAKLAEIALTLPGFGAIRGTAPALFTRPTFQDAMYIRLESEGLFAASVVLYSAIAAEAAIIDAARVDKINAPYQAHLAHVVRGNSVSPGVNYTTWIQVVNLSPVPQEVTLDFVHQVSGTNRVVGTRSLILDGSGTVTVPNENVTFPPNFGSGWVKLSGTERFAAFAAIGDSGGSVAPIPSQAGGAAQLLLPHFADLPPWITGIALLNSTNTEANIEIFAISPDGKLIGGPETAPSARFSLPAQSKTAKLLKEFIPQTQGRSSDGGFLYIRSTNDVPIMAVELFFSRDGTQAANVPAMSLDPNLSFAVPRSESPVAAARRKIAVDGDASDWSGLRPLLAGQISNHSWNLYIADDGTNLYILAEPKADMIYFGPLFFDTDQNRQTGCQRIGGYASQIGADYTATLFRRSEFVGLSSVQRTVEDSHGNCNPVSSNSLSGLNVAFGEKYIEAAIPLSSLGSSTGAIDIGIGYPWADRPISATYVLSSR